MVTPGKIQKTKQKNNKKKTHNPANYFFGAFQPIKEKIQKNPPFLSQK